MDIHEGLKDYYIDKHLERIKKPVVISHEEKELFYKLCKLFVDSMNLVEFSKELLDKCKKATPPCQWPFSVMRYAEGIPNWAQLESTYYDLTCKLDLTKKYMFYIDEYIYDKEIADDYAIETFDTNNFKALYMRRHASGFENVTQNAKTYTLFKINYFIIEE